MERTVGFLRGGTGSYPPGCHGPHRSSLRTVSQEPRSAPWVVSASTAYALQLGSNRWRIQAFVENIADTREDTFSFGNPFTGAQAYATPLRPRTVGLSVGADF